MHQPLHQVVPPPPPQAHQPSQRLLHHSLHLNLPPFQGHVNFRPINHSHTSQSTPISTPPLVVPVQFPLPHLCLPPLPILLALLFLGRPHQGHHSGRRIIKLSMTFLLLGLSTKSIKHIFSLKYCYIYFS